jgi:hypothetical protein
MRITISALTVPAVFGLISDIHAATIQVDQLGPNDLIITEYLANPVGVSDADAEYFEIFNARADTVDLSGLVVQDDGSNSFTVTALSIAPGSFAVLSNGDGSALGFTVDYIYGSSMSLTNTDDEISLLRPDAALVHKLVYTDGDFFGDGVAHELVAVGPETPIIVNGPAAGSDFLAASAPLLLSNFGSPGAAGNTLIDMPAVPLPPAAWLFASGLALLVRVRRVLKRQPGTPCELQPACA